MGTSVSLSFQNDGELKKNNQHLKKMRKDYEKKTDDEAELSQNEDDINYHDADVFVIFEDWLKEENPVKVERSLQALG
jgi:hypothetical protein